jgi:hypothetical protein
MRGKLLNITPDVLERSIARRDGVLPNIQISADVTGAELSLTAWIDGECVASTMSSTPGPTPDPPPGGAGGGGADNDVRQSTSTGAQPMKGELWEPCPECGTEPVCANCQLCKSHCCCSKPKPEPDPEPGPPFRLFDGEDDMPHPAKRPAQEPNP